MIGTLARPDSTPVYLAHGSSDQDHPKSLLGVAVASVLRQWDKFTVFLRDGNIALDNDRIERAVKPFFIGRKNWLFCNTPRGANAAALLYSLIETARLNGLAPAASIEHLLNRPGDLRIVNPATLDLLLPWSSDIQALCSKAALKAKGSGRYYIPTPLAAGCI